MTAWRRLAAGLLALVIVAPLLPVGAGLTHRAVWHWSEADRARLAQLAISTSLLVFGALVLAVPTGVGLAVLLFRTRLPGRRLAQLLLLLLLFMPLPVLVSSWQGFLGQGGWWPSRWWGFAEDRPWATGLGPAIWVHAVAALPWVVFVVGLGLVWIEPELEEEALLRVGPCRVLWEVTLPRCRPAIAAAVLLTGLFTANEISVTDVMLVPTLAEEVHTQFTLGEDEALSRTLLLALPLLLPLWGTVLVASARLERVLPPLAMLNRDAPCLMQPPRAVGPLVVAGVAALIAVPCGSLVWKVGLSGTPLRWSVTQAVQPLVRMVSLYGAELAGSLGLAFVTGFALTLSALVLAWLAVGSASFRTWLLLVLSAAWVLPAPVVGIALKQTILTLVGVLPPGPWSDAIYYGPSPLPLLWVCFMRFLPVAVFFLVPVVRLIPRELHDAARLHGASPLGEFLHLVLPLSWPALLTVALVGTALSFGEIGASARVETPNCEPFAKLIFDRMHYGVDSDVSALCLLLVGTLVLPVILATMGRAVVSKVKRGLESSPLSPPGERGRG